MRASERGPVVQSRAAGGLLTSVRECDRVSYSPCSPPLSKRKRKTRRVSGNTSWQHRAWTPLRLRPPSPFERIARPHGRRSIDGQASRPELHPAGRWATAPQQRPLPRACLHPPGGARTPARRLISWGPPAIWPTRAHPQAHCSTAAPADTARRLGRGPMASPATRGTIDKSVQYTPTRANSKIRIPWRKM